MSLDARPTRRPARRRFRRLSGLTLILSGCSALLDLDTPASESGPVACANGADDDLDGQADCLDPDCREACRPSVDSARVRLEVAPWGTRSDGAPSSRAIGAEGAVRGARRVLVVGAIDGELLADGVVDPTGAFTVELPAPSGGDIPSVRLLPLGPRAEAGLEPPDPGASIPITALTWKASLRGRRPGTSFPNPHLVTRVPTAASSLVQPGAEEPPASALVAWDDGAAPLDGAFERVWTRAPETERWRDFDAAATFDPRRGAVVAYASDGRTRTWDGTRWRSLAIPPGPPLAAGFALAYSTHLGRVVLFGGEGRDGRRSNDLHVLEPGGWTRLDPVTSVRPPPRTYAGLVEHEAAGRLHVFGGCLTGICDTSDALWAFDGRTWSEVEVVDGDRPPGGESPSLVYDRDRSRLLLGGGYIGNRVRPFVWTFGDGRWETIASVESPESLNWASLAFSPTLGGILLLRTVIPDPTEGPARTTAWVLEGGTWSALPGRAEDFVTGALAADPLRGGLVISPHSTEARNDARTWRLAPSGWSATHPNGLSGEFGNQGAAAYDEGRRRLVLFGGQDSSGAFTSTLWEFDDDGWYRPAPRIEGSSAPPEGRILAHAAYDAQRGVTVIFGGARLLPDGSVEVFQDTWEWDGTTLTRRALPSSPPPTAAGTMVYDRSAREIVLFGGRVSGVGDSDQTWTYDGTTWREASPATAPSPRSNAAGAYHPDRGGVLVVGGRRASIFPGRPPTFAFDTWRWDGQRREWERLLPAPEGALGRAYGSMAFDGARQVMVFQGGGTSDELTDAIGETWLLGPSGPWVRVPTVGSEPRRQLHALAYSVGRRAVLAVGGIGVEDRPELGDTITTLPELTAFDGSRWSPVASSLAPGRVCDGSASVPLDAAPLIAGGCADPTCADRGIALTWRWQEGDWRVDNSRSGLPRRRRPGIAPDRRLGPDAWWVFGGGVEPATRLYHRLSGDGIQGRFVDALNLFGDTVAAAPVGAAPAFFTRQGELWEVNEAGIDRRDFSVDPREGFASATSTAGVVVFGGKLAAESPPLGQGWRFTAADGWTRLADGPPRAGHAMAWDTIRDRPLVVFGEGPDGRVDDVYELVGGAWRTLPTTDEGPSARSAHVAFYDPDGRILVVTGGTEDGAECLDETWTLSLDPRDRPALLFVFETSVTGLSRDAVDAIRLEGVGRGVGQDGERSGPLTGTHVEVWTEPPGRWTRWGEADDDQTLRLEAEDAEAARRMVDADGRVYVRWLPRGGSFGTDPPRVAVDELELEVGFALDAEP